jgi:hypothetical protein
MANEEKAHLKSLGDILTKNVANKWKTSSTLMLTVI